MVWDNGSVYIVNEHNKQKENNLVQFHLKGSLVRHFFVYEISK